MGSDRTEHVVRYSGGASVAVAPGASTAVAPGASVPVVPGASLAVAPATRTEPPRPKDDARPLLTTSCAADSAALTELRSFSHEG